MTKFSRLAILTAFFIATAALTVWAAPPGEMLSTISLPPGFAIDIYSAEVPGARSIARGDNGTIFVSTRGEGRVYALRDENGDFKADTVYTILSGLSMPNGVAFRNGSLYVAEISRILRLDNIEARLSDPPEPVVVYDRLPTDSAHGWKYINFGPEGKLYVPVGAPCNICEPPGRLYGTILRMDADGSNLEIYARGIRNSVGFDWNPRTNVLWFTDNGRDWLGDNRPPDELNRAPKAGLHFGYPYLHGKDIHDPQYWPRRPEVSLTRPVQELGPHVAALGMHFYRGTQFPAGYRNQIFIAEHGSWNRSVPIGYRVTLVRHNGAGATSYKVFASGWLQSNGQAWGRPVDVFELPDGSLLVSDDKAGAVYRISYRGS